MKLDDTDSHETSPQASLAIQTASGAAKGDFELEERRSRVLQKIGRNLLLFQQLEAMLKRVVANGRVPPVPM